jgi:NAD(P)-dependent dehydrogenase (short-subunit alcohol dehydrogenase family)
MLAAIMSGTFMTTTTRRLALVTGAAQGNGRAIAIGLAAAGHEVIVTDLNHAGATETAALITTNGKRAHAYPLDVTDRAAVAAFAAQCARQHGDLAVLVNNAGIIARGGVLSDNVLEKWDDLRRVNIDGLLNVCHAFVPQLIKTKGAILNLASILSVAASGQTLAYGATKGAVKQITQALAVELAPHGVRVNAIAPGVIATPMTESTRANPAALEAFMARTPMRRVGQPEELVGAVNFLVSDAASYITGALLPVDGGYLAG